MHILQPLTAEEMTNPANLRIFVDTALGGIPDAGLEAEEVSRAIIDGKVQAWKLGAQEPDKPINLIGTAITQILYGVTSKSKTLYITAFKINPRTPPEGWAELMEQLLAHAKQMGCSRIEALTKSPAVIRVAKQHGFDSNWRMLVKEI